MVSEQSRLFAVPKTPGDLRDIALVLASVVYFLGFLTWALHAQWNSLGLLPGVDSQYFAAGLLPTCVLAASLVLAGLLRRFSRWSAAAGESLLVVRIAQSAVQTIVHTSAPCGAR